MQGAARDLRSVLGPVVNIIEFGRVEQDVLWDIEENIAVLFDVAALLPPELEDIRKISLGRIFR